MSTQLCQLERLPVGHGLLVVCCKLMICGQATASAGSCDSLGSVGNALRKIVHAGKPP